MRLRPILLTFISIFFSSSIFAQSVTLDWAKQFSGPDAEIIFDIKIDGNGNIFTVGGFAGTVDFDPGPAVNSLTNSGLSADGFVKKLDPNGNLIWVRHLKGGEINIRDLEIRNGNQLMLIGDFRDSIDINQPTSGLPLFNSGNREVFNINLDTNGNFIAAVKYDGSSYAYGMDIAWKDNYGIWWNVGYFNDTLYNIGNPVVAGTTATFFDNFTSIRVLRGSDQVNVSSADLSTEGSLFAVGLFSDEIYMPPGGPALDTITSINSLDGFIYKEYTNGSPIWLKAIQGNGITFPGQVLQDPKDLSGGSRPHSLLIAGTYTETVDFDPDTAATFNLSSVNLNPDVFLQKLDTAGNFKWAKSFGGKQSDQFPIIDTDDHGNIFMAGSFQDTADFDPSPATANLITTPGSGSSEIFLVKLDSSGNFIWAVQFGGSLASHQALGIKTVNNSIFLSGYFQDSIDFDPSTATNLFISQNRSIDAFVIKLNDRLVGVEKIDQTSQLKLYPNPSPGLIKIDNSTGNWKRLEILDLQGRLLMTKENLNKDILDLELSDIPNGTYIIRFEGESMSTVQKFVLRK